MTEKEQKVIAALAGVTMGLVLIWAARTLVVTTPDEPGPMEGE